MKVVDQPSLEFHNDFPFPLRIAIRAISIGLVVDQNELYNFLGDGEMALKYQLRAKQLDPFLPAYCRELEAVAYYILGQYADTVAVVAQLSRATRIAAAYRVAAYRHLDDPTGLKRAVCGLRIIDPILPSIDFWPLNITRISGCSVSSATTSARRGSGFSRDNRSGLESRSTAGADNPSAPGVGATRSGIAQCGLFPTPYQGQRGHTPTCDCPRPRLSESRPRTNQLKQIQRREIRQGLRSLASGPIDPV